VATDARIPNPAIFPWRSRAAIASGAVGQRGRAEELLEEELELARRFGAPRPIGVALVAAGVVRGVEGAEALEEAVETLAASPARLEHARALVALGAHHRRRGQRRVAAELLNQGLEVGQACGAVAICERARGELVAIGLSPRRRSLGGVEALTPAERRVAGLAVEGLTNREIAQALFVSLRTVETHLTHCYQKLGIESRGRLAVALAERESTAV
jgi:DNA-binding CsgD family transcriptional regulator